MEKVQSSQASPLGGLLEKQLKRWERAGSYVDINKLRRYFFDKELGLNSYPKGLSLLDMGCGVWSTLSQTGEEHEVHRGPRFSLAAVENGWRVTGFDQQPLGRPLPAGWTFLQGDMCSSQFWAEHFSSSSFDLVSAQLLFSLLHPADVSPSLRLEGCFSPYHQLTDFFPTGRDEGPKNLRTDPLYLAFLEEIFGRVHAVLKEQGVLFVGGQLERFLFVKEGHGFRSLLPWDPRYIQPRLVVKLD